MTKIAQIISNSWDKVPKTVKAIIWNGIAAASALAVADLQELQNESNKYVSIGLGITASILIWGSIKLVDKRAVK